MRPCRESRVYANVRVDRRARPRYRQRNAALVGPRRGARASRAPARGPGAGAPRPELTGDLEQLVEDRYRLFVTPQPGERQRLESTAAQQGLRAVDVARDCPRALRKVDRAFVLTSPVGGVCMHVQVLREIETS